MTAGGFQTFPQVHLEEACLLTNTRTSRVCTLVIFSFSYIVMDLIVLRYCKLAGFLAELRIFEQPWGVFFFYLLFGVGVGGAESLADVGSRVAVLAVTRLQALRIDVKVRGRTLTRTAETSDRLLWVLSTSDPDHKQKSETCDLVSSLQQTQDPGWGVFQIVYFGSSTPMQDTAMNYDEYCCPKSCSAVFALTGSDDG